MQNRRSMSNFLDQTYQCITFKTHRSPMISMPQRLTFCRSTLFLG